MPGTRTSVFINGEAAMGGGAGGGGENENGTIEIFPGGLSPGPDDVDRNNSFGVADHDNDDGGASF
eukprot:1368812-Prorocentrum_lima.AAC.1